MYAEDYPAVVNHRALVDMLEDVAEPLGFKVSTDWWTGFCMLLGFTPSQLAPVRRQAAAGTKQCR